MAKFCNSADLITRGGVLEDVDRLAIAGLRIEISDNVEFSIEEEEQLIELQNNLFFQALFSLKSLDKLWLSVHKSYPMIGVKAIKIMLPFVSSWFCEYGFSALTEIKSKKRERLLVSDDMKCRQ